MEHMHISWMHLFLHLSVFASTAKKLNLCVQRPKSTRQKQIKQKQTNKPQPPEKTIPPPPPPKKKKKKKQQTTTSINIDDEKHRYVMQRDQVI